ncbi:MAG: hypothetical protein JWO02_3714, partial [Solirubrobacterales bacterium]|nr:hypothetical protein [Solirubrobacterales bacterium]
MDLTVHERRMRLLDAVAALLEHHTPAEVTVERVAAQAGTSVRSVRHY